MRLPHGQPRARRGRIRGGRGGRRARVRRPRRRSGGRYGRQTDHGAAGGSRTRARRGDARTELHGGLRSGRRRRRGTDSRRTPRRPVASPCSVNRARLPTRFSRSAVGSGSGASSPRVRRRSRTPPTSSRSSRRTTGRRAVGLFLETVRRPDAFVDALRRCAEAGKPVACLKVGRSEAAARAALSHTGALVGSDRAFSAVLNRYSAIEVEDFHELVETLEILGRRRRPTGTRIAGISESGGECALLADSAEAAGIPFEPLSDDLAARAVGSLSELPRSRKPTRRMGHRGRDGGVPALARAPRRVGRLRRPPRPGRPLPVPRSDERRVVRADAPHSRAPARRTRDAVLRDDDRAQRRSSAPLPGARARARRAAAPRPARRDARGRARGTASPVRALAREQRPGRRRPPRPGRGAARARVVARSRAARRPVRSQAPCGDPGRGGARGGRARHARRREVGRRRTQGPRRRVVLGVATPEEAADAARRLGGPVVVARQAEAGTRCSAA